MKTPRCGAWWGMGSSGAPEWKAPLRGRNVVQVQPGHRRVNLFGPQAPEAGPGWELHFELPCNPKFKSCRHRRAIARSGVPPETSRDQTRPPLSGIRKRLNAAHSGAGSGTWRDSTVPFSRGLPLAAPCCPWPNPGVTWGAVHRHWRANSQLNLLVRTAKRKTDLPRSGQKPRLTEDRRVPALGNSGGRRELECGCPLWP